MQLESIYLDFQEIDNIPGRIAYLENLRDSDFLKDNPELNIKLDGLIEAWLQSKRRL